MGVKVARLVGEGVAVVVRADDVRGWLAMGVRNTRRGRGIPISLYDSGGGCGGRCAP